jgi:hypothetical protein
VLLVLPRGSQTTIKEQEKHEEDIKGGNENDNYIIDRVVVQATKLHHYPVLGGVGRHENHPRKKEVSTDSQSITTTSFSSSTNNEQQPEKKETTQKKAKSPKPFGWQFFKIWHL